MTSLGPADPAVGRTDRARAVVAPSVVARLERVAPGDPRAVDQLAAVLRPVHLDGGALLPDPLPAVPAVQARVPTAVLAPEERRVLVCAALAVTERAEVVLHAAAADAAVLARPVVRELLAVRDGRATLRDVGVRAALHAGTALSERSGLHAALARSARRVGDAASALWHTAASTLSGDELLADGLLELADLLLSRGDAESAHLVAREAISHATGVRRARAFLLSGRSALWSGHLDDAERWLRRAAGCEVPEVAGAADAMLAPTLGLRRGSPDGSTAAHAPGGAGAALSRLVVPVGALAATPSDRAALASAVDALHLLDSDPAAADAALARAVVGAVPTVRRPGPWPVVAGALTPLAEAHLRVVQALVLVCTGERGVAAEVLSDGVARLPVSHVVGGLVADLTAHLGAEPGARGGAPAAAWQRWGPERSVAAGAVTALLPGAVPPSGSTLALAAAPAPRVDESGQEGPAGLPAAWSSALTARELQVVAAVARGRSNRQVSDELSVSVRTVEVHLGRVFRKIGVSSRSELLVRALRPAD
ncbi:helix-turn-helix transcriptional regulator [Isoptericola sp. AK164]|uniref:helix-turn-helix transcriptional regulator n=1 Tax=Isoptericola sp. AK164 TaxID=3024246 RepID=UPI002418B12E|nr:helix-turn-helix transcriptional regulator [Isoptericola sp. AK164]